MRADSWPESGAPRLVWPVLRTVLVIAGLLLLCRWALAERPGGGAWVWHPGLATGFFASALSFVLFALRFRSVMRIVDLDMPQLVALRISAAAQFYHCFVPLGVGAEVTRFARCRALAPYLSPALMASGIAFDRVLGLAVTLALALLMTALVRPGLLSGPGPVPLVLGFVAAFVVAAVLVARRYARRRANGRLRAAWRRLRERRGHLIDACALSLAMQFTLAGSIFAAGSGWALPLQYVEVLWVVAASSVLQLLPLNAAGVNAGDLAGTGLYVALGLSLPDAILLSAVFYLYRLGIAFVGGLLEIVPTLRRASSGA
jgi:uncharacterized membrane protein YbhN (UPF0104 family)